MFPVLVVVNDGRVEWCRSVMLWVLLVFLKVILPGPESWKEGHGLDQGLPIGTLIRMYVPLANVGVCCAVFHDVHNSVGCCGILNSDL